MTRWRELDLGIKGGDPSIMGHEDSPPTRETPAARSDAGPAPLLGEWQGSPCLTGFPHLTEGFLQLLSVGRVAPLQALQLLVFLLVQDAQEIL